MKRYKTILLIGFFLSTISVPGQDKSATTVSRVLSGDKIGDINSYRKIEFSSSGKELMANADFEKDMEQWSAKSVYKIDETGGKTGPKALFYERKDPAEYVLCQQGLKIKQGKYRFGGWIRTQRSDPKQEIRACIALEFYNGKTFLGGGYLGAESDKWQYISGTADVPAAANNVVFTLYANKGQLGKIWIDDLTLEEDKPSFAAWTILPRSETAFPGKLDFLLGLEFTAGQSKAGNLTARVVTEFAGKTIAEGFYPILNNRVSGSTDLPQAGEYILKLQVLDTGRKEILGEDLLYWTCRNKDITPPANACIINADGKAVVNGKPFMPVGLYMMHLYDKDIKKVADSPFNTLMPYCSPWLKLEKDQKVGEIEGINQVLDACNKNNLKVIFSIKDVYVGVQQQVLSFAGAKGEEEVLRKIMSSFAGHPSLLAWYVADELRPEQRDRVYARRRLIRQLDPWHPAWAVYIDYAAMPLYGKTADILGVDPYPFVEKQAHYSMGQLVGAMDMANVASADTEGNAAIWVVPQAHNVGNYNSAISKEELNQRFRAPSEKEMRSMALLYAAKGAKGFIFYSYFDLWRDRVKEVGEQRWIELCNVGKLLKELEPFIMSGNKIKKLNVINKSGSSIAVEMIDNSGNRKIIVAGIESGLNEAVIQPETADSLKSRFGTCTKNPDGSFSFKCEDINSDILE